MKITSVLLLLLPSLLFAQQNVELGDTYFDFFQYKEAIVAYEDALAKDKTYKNEAHILSQLAYCYSHTFQYEKWR
jgi:tetratricopeptide (TPR) repeat protein